MQENNTVGSQKHIITIKKAPTRGTFLMVAAARLTSFHSAARALISFADRRSPPAFRL